MERSEFLIRKMDCPSEETMIRMKLAEVTGIARLDFDIEQRMLVIFHNGNTQRITNLLGDLNFDSSLVKSEIVEDNVIPESASHQEALLWKVLIVNFVLFVVEMAFGIFSRSLGLIADSLDMLADASVYGLSLFAVHAATSRKKSIAKISGYLQMTLAVIGVVEVVRRFTGYEDLPDFEYMIGISLLALIGNIFCLFLLQKGRSTDPHMKASMIFTSNDVIINAGVILAGILVYFLNSRLPDLIIGIIVFAIVIRGAFSILALGKE